MHSRQSVTEVARHFADYLNRVAFRGERFTLMRSGKPIAELGPVPAGMQLRRLSELLASLPRLGEEDVERFATDLEKSREALRDAAVRDPWES